MRPKWASPLSLSRPIELVVRVSERLEQLQRTHLGRGDFCASMAHVMLNSPPLDSEVPWEPLSFLKPIEVSRGGVYLGTPTVRQCGGAAGNPQRFPAT